MIECSAYLNLSQFNEKLKNNSRLLPVSRSRRCDSRRKLDLNATRKPFDVMLTPQIVF